MTRKKRRPKTVSPQAPSTSDRQKRSRRRWLLAGGLAATLLAGGLYLSGSRPSVPDPDVSEAEPQVAAKIREARNAVIANPRSAESWGHWGMVLQAHGMEADAVLCYREAVRLASSDFRWRYLLAHALKNSTGAQEEGEEDRVQQALVQAAEASELRPDYAPVFLLRGQLLEQLNRPQEALDQYRKAVAVDPQCTPAQFGLGRLYFTAGEVEASRHHLELAAEQNPDAGPIRGFLARVYRRLGDDARASEEARRAAELTGKVTIRDPIYFQMTDEAVSSVALLDRASEASKVGDLTTAEAIYRELVAIRPDDADMHTRLGDVLAQQDKLREAKEQYLAALEIHPQQPSALYGLGNMLNYERRYDEAAQRYRESLALRPDHVASLLNLGSILAFQGHLPEAAAEFQKVLEIEPRSFGAHRQLGEVLLQQGKPAEAARHLRAALEIQPEVGPLHVQLAVALAGSGDVAGAWDHVRAAQELGQEVPPELVKALQRRPPGSD